MDGAVTKLGFVPLSAGCVLKEKFKLSANSYLVAQFFEHSRVFILVCYERAICFFVFLYFQKYLKNTIYLFLKNGKIYLI